MAQTPVTDTLERLKTALADRYAGTSSSPSSPFFRPSSPS